MEELLWLYDRSRGTLGREEGQLDLSRALRVSAWVWREIHTGFRFAPESSSTLFVGFENSHVGTNVWGLCVCRRRLVR